MNLDGGQSHGRDGVAKGDTGVGQATGVDDQALRLAARLLDAIDKGAFVVGLESLDVETQFLTAGHEALIDLLQGGVPVHCGLARTEQIQVRTMQDHHHRLSGR